MAKPTLIYLTAVLALSALLNLVPYTSSFPYFARRTQANHGNPFQATSATPCQYRFVWKNPESAERYLESAQEIDIYIYSRRGDIILRERLTLDNKVLPVLQYHFTVIPATIVLCFNDANHREISRTSAVLPQVNSNSPEQLYYLP